LNLLAASSELGSTTPSDTVTRFRAPTMTNPPLMITSMIPKCTIHSPSCTPAAELPPLLWKPLRDHRPIPPDPSSSCARLLGRRCFVQYCTVLMY
jgi:hypothetical protein